MLVNMCSKGICLNVAVLGIPQEYWISDGEKWEAMDAMKLNK